MNLRTQFSNMGVNISEDMDPEAFVRTVSACPIIIQAFPELGNFIDTTQNLIDGHYAILEEINSLEKTIESAEDGVDGFQSALNNVNTSYTAFLATTPTAFEGTGVGEVVIKPTAANTTLQTTITVANQTLEEAKKQLKKYKETLEKLKAKAEEYYKALLAKVKEFVKSMMNTQVN